MLIKLWGVRGSMISPLSNDEYHIKMSRILNEAVKSGLNKSSDIEDFIKKLPDDLRYIYGGNTTCATVTSKSGKMYIIDCGSGIRPLGYELMKGDCGKGKGVVNILLTHNHWDHIQGLPFFTPLYVPGNTLHFYSPYKDQAKILEGQMSPPYFPATFSGTPSIKQFTTFDVKERKSFKLEDDLIVDFHPLKHPGGSFAYRFMQEGKIFIFATDAEFTGESLENMEDKSDDFFKNADLLVLDAQYTLDESFTKFDWGHTSFTMAVNCGVRWNIKKLIMTHHEPSYSDSKLYENYLAAIEHRNQIDNGHPQIFMATEGMTFQL